MIRQSLRITVALLLLCFTSTKITRGQAPTIDDIRQMWAEREAAAKTVHVHWVESTARSYSSFEPGGRGQKVVEESDNVLWLGESPLVRYQFEPLREDADDADQLTRPGLHLSTFDGKRNNDFTSATGPDDHHRCIVRDGKFYDQIANYHLHAVLMFYRPSQVIGKYWSASGDADIAQYNSDLRIVEGGVKFKGRTCLIIETVADDTPVSYVNRYWVDAERGGLILQHVAGPPGQAATHMTIEYQQQGDEWRPKSWDAKFLNGTMSTSGSLVDVTLNDPIPAEMFQIDCPPGTVIFDRDLGMRTRVLPDGSEETIPPGDTPN